MMVSICIPVYGVEKYIERCARSLFEQSYDDIEYIFVNDCTKDNSIVILKDIIEEYPQRKSHIRIINHLQNKGLAATRNTAVEAANGEFILHVDSDDYLELDGVELLMTKQKEGNYDLIPTSLHVIYKGYDTIRPFPSVYSPKELSLLLLSRKVPLGVAGKLIRKSLYVDNRIKTIEGINMGEDYQITPRLAFFAKRVATLNRYIYNYDCTNEQSITASFNINKTYQVFAALDVLHSFFVDKGGQFKDALAEAHTKILCRELINFALSNGDKKDYVCLKSEIPKLNKTAIRNENIFYQVLLMINNKTILRIYVLTITTLNRIRKRIQICK